MATVSAAIDQAAEPKTLDALLWWDSFCDLLTQLERLSFSDDVPPLLVNKLKENGQWLSDGIMLFKPPNSTSKTTLNYSTVKIGSHSVGVRGELRNAALELSSCLDLDELQSYLLISRFLDSNSIVGVDKVRELLHMVVVSYYQERQCLLKCTRQILMLALSIPIELKEKSVLMESARKLIRDGLEEKLFSTFVRLVSSKHPEPLPAEFTGLWAEEILVEASLVLEILFLVYYEPFLDCNAKRWKDLCLLFKDILSGSRNVAMLVVSAEAAISLFDVKLQLFLILVETLEHDNLIQMVHNEVPFRKGKSAFSCSDLVEMDAIISSLSATETVEAAPLLLAWGTFLCLVSSLPEAEDCLQILDIDHAGYVRQAFEAGVMEFFLEILCSHMLKNSDAVVTGYRSVLKTYISAFIASYDLEDSSRNAIIDILQQIYSGQEALCIQFWDRNVFVDGPIRCLLLSLQDEYPQHTTKLVRMLSALCVGDWSAECVCKYLNKMVTFTTYFHIPDNYSPKPSLTFVAQEPISVPHIEGLTIPTGTVGHVLKVLNDNVALVRWEFLHSGLLVLLLRLGSVFHAEDYEEALVVLDLLCHLITSNKDVAVSLMDIEKFAALETQHANNHFSKYIRVDLVKIICNMVDIHSSRVKSAPMLSLCIQILTTFLKCSPTRVLSEVFKTRIFECDLTGSSSGIWFLAGRAAKIGSIYQVQESCTLIVSVLDFCMQLVEIGVEDESASSFILFCLRYALVNHEQWKRDKKDEYWKVKLKVIEVLKNCLALKDRRKLGSLIQNILLHDSSMNHVLLQIITSDTLEKLHLNRLYKPKEIEELQQIIRLALDIIYLMLSYPHKENTSIPVFHQALLHATTKPVTVVVSVISLISFSRNPALQLAAAKVLCRLCMLSEKAYPHLVGGLLSFISNDVQVERLSASLSEIMSSKIHEDKDLFVSIIDVLIASAIYQPPFLLYLFFHGEGASEASGIGEPDRPGDKLQPQHSPSLLRLRESGRLINSLLKYLEGAPDLIKSDPGTILRILHFLRILWQGGTQFINIVKILKGSKFFWENLSTLAMTSDFHPSSGNTGGNLHLAYVYHCQSTALDIMACDILWKQKLLNKETAKDTAASTDVKNSNTVKSLKDSNESPNVEDIISKWHKESTILRMIKSSVPCVYDRNIIHQALMAGSLSFVHLVMKLLADDVGSLSLTYANIVKMTAQKLSEQPAFLHLVSQRSMDGCSPMHELRLQIFSDLCHHIQDDLSMLRFPSGQLKELAQFLLQLNPWQSCKPTHSILTGLPAQTDYPFDMTSLRADLGLDFWVTLEWRKLKTVAENMLSRMEDANQMALLADSQVSKLKSLTLLFSTYTKNLADVDSATHDQGSLQSFEASIHHLSKCLHKAAVSDYGIDTMEQNILEAQTDALLLLVSNLYGRNSPSSNKQPGLSLCLLIVKSAVSNLKIIIDVKSFYSRPTKVVKHLLAIILLSMVHIKHVMSENSSACVGDAATETMTTSLGVLTVLCSAVVNADYCDLSLVALDVILSGILGVSMWLPVLQGHLPLPDIMRLLQQLNSAASVDLILKFLLTLARVRGGAEMLVKAKFSSSLKVLLNLSLDDEHQLSNSAIENGSLTTSKQKRCKHVWELGMAILAAMVNSLGEDPLSEMIVEHAASYLFSEKPHLMSYLSAPNFPPTDRDKKRTRIPKPQTSLLSLRETEHALILICEFSKHRAWLKVARSSDSQLRERIIHFLAFISKEPHHFGKSSNKSWSFFCPPTLQEERELCKRPSFVHSKYGWFALAGSCDASKDTVIASPDAKLRIMQGKSDEDTGSGKYTYFSYLTAMQIYKITVLLLKFLCMQAMVAAKSAEDVGVVDFAHFPELPMPEILHGLQDQAVAIVTDLFKGKRSTVTPDLQKVSLLMMQIMEKALYLELCVSQICGMRPVSARVEDFFKEFKALIEASKGHTFLEPSMKCVKQIIVLLYPELLQMDGIPWS